jgi:cation diffusion facilitator CzcD-associated flavoprotein CzcO
MNDPVDVLIIGAGASGAAVAWSLADTKMHILRFNSQKTV